VVLDIAQKVLLIVYFCLAYIFIFSFLTFIVSITFLRTFKTKKLQLLYILGWQKKKLLSGVFWEYSYLVIGGIILSVMLGTMLLYILSGFIDFFEIDAASYISGLWVLAGLFSIMCIYLKLSKKSL
jgi:ABC-type lipoprotein release transport system permease subunit